MPPNDLLHCVELFADPALGVDGTGTILVANAALADALGQPSASIIGHRLNDITCNTADVTDRALRFSSRSRDPCAGALTLRKADGTAFKFPYRGILLRPRTPQTPSLIVLQYEPGAQLAALQGRIGQLRTETRRKARAQVRRQRRLADLTRLRESLLGPESLAEKAHRITEALVTLLEADAACLWIVDRGDACEAPCPHAIAPNASDRCGRRDQCLHLIAVSGPRAGAFGAGHHRVPLGGGGLGRIAIDGPWSAGPGGEFPTPHSDMPVSAEDPVAGPFVGYPLKAADGTLLGVLAVFTTCAAAEDADGTLQSVAHVAAQVIHASQAEQALRRSEARYRSLAEGAPVGIFRTDSVYGLTDANAAWVALTGLSLERSVGDGWLAAVHGEDRSRVENACRDAALRQHPTNFECRFRLPDGTVRWAYVQSMPQRQADGTVIAHLGTATDVTVRKRAEDERNTYSEHMQHVQKLESLSVLAGGIAHDFNNLLTSILGGAELAELELPGDSSARSYLKVIRESALRATELTRQMLAYSGKGHFVLDVLDLGGVVAEAGHLLKAALPEQVEFHCRLASEVPAVKADVSQLRQVLMNLVRNAGEAIGSRSGTVTISTGGMEADQTYLAGTYLDDRLPPGLYTYLEVTDTGIGMEPEVVKRSFEPFYTTKFQGRGLGLPAVLGIVRGHRGAIVVDSTPGRGTTVRILLPAVHQPVHADAPGMPIDAEHWRGSGTALVVEDEEPIRNMAKRFLMRLGFTVLTANDGREGVDVFRQHAKDIAVVLLDMTMPRMNGREAFAEIRRIQPDARVILSSGYSEHEVTDAFAGKGLAGFVQKPYRLSTLRNAVRAAVER